MDHYAGIDVSLECSSVWVVDASGKIVRQAKVASEPEALIGWFGSIGFGLERIGSEAGMLSQWLYAAIEQAGLAVELLETRHVYEAFKSMPVKSDRNDARKIAQLMRLGWFRPVHCKSITAQEIRAMLTARKAGAEQTPRRREQPARDFARLRAEGRQDDADKFCRTHRRTGEGAPEPSDNRGGAASDAGRSACRVQRF
jgi:transposase